MHHLHWYVVALTTLFVIAHLTWEYIHGGVESHHLFARSDMPAISNWWGLVILPLLGWLASWLVLLRAGKETKALQKAIAGALGALFIGITLSISFQTGHEQISSYIFFTALFLGIIFPVYRAEYVYGFVLGMAFVFGAVLPTLFALIGVIISAISHFLIRPTFNWVNRALLDCNQIWN